MKHQMSTLAKLRESVAAERLEDWKSEQEMKKVIREYNDAKSRIAKSN
eukprot:UN09744